MILWAMVRLCIEIPAQITRTPIKDARFSYFSQGSDGMKSISHGDMVAKLPALIHVITVLVNIK